MDLNFADLGAVPSPPPPPQRAAKQGGVDFSDLGAIDSPNQKIQKPPIDFSDLGAISTAKAGPASPQPPASAISTQPVKPDISGGVPTPSPATDDHRSAWAQQHPFLSKFLPDPTTAEHQETASKVVQDQAGKPQPDTGDFYANHPHIVSALKALSGGDEGEPIDPFGIGQKFSEGLKTLGSGLKDIYTPTPAEQRETETPGYTERGGVGSISPMTDDERSAANRRAIGGLAKVLAGGGTVGLVLGAPELAGLGAAAATGDTVAIAALARIRASVGVGAGASAGAGKIADNLKLSPEAKALAQQAAFWTGAGMTVYGLKVEPTVGEFGEKGVRASVRGVPASVEGGFRPAYRQPAPEGGFGEESTVRPGKVTAAVTVGNRRVGTAPETVLPTAPAVPPQPKLLSADVAPAGEQPAEPAPAAAPDGSVQPSDNNRTFTGPATAETMAQRRGTAREPVPEPVQPSQTPSAAASAPPAAAKPSGVPFDTGGFDFDQYEAAQRGQTPPVDGDRPVVQGSTDHAAIRESAATQEKPTVAAVEKAVEDVPGAEVTGSRVKDEDSQLNKADRDKPVETQKDHLGVRVAVDDDAVHRAAVGSIAQKLPVVATEPLDNNGLAGTQVFVKTGRPGEANQTSEIQVVPKSQVEAMKETDALYDQQKEALAAGDTAKADALGKQITEIHEAALKSASPVKSDDLGTSSRPEQSATTAEQGGRGESPEPTAGVSQTGAPAAETPATSDAVPQQVKTGSNVVLPDGRSGIVKGISLKGDVEVKLDGGGRTKAKRTEVRVVDPKAPVQGVTEPVPGGERVPKQGAIAVDLDKTLAAYTEYKGPGVIGAPIREQVAQIKKMLADGEDVWLYSARAKDPEFLPAARKWTKEHLGQELPVTNVKYPQFAKFIDDRAELPVQMQGEAKDAEVNDEAEGSPAGQDGDKGEVRADVAGAEGGGRSGEGREAVEPRPGRPATEAGKEVSLTKRSSYTAPASALGYSGTKFDKLSINENEKEIGQLEVQVGPSEVTVRNVLLANESDTGRGIGQKAYRVLQSTYPDKTIRSSFNRNISKGNETAGLSDQAIGMWDSLTRKGEAQKIVSGDRFYYQMTPKREPSPAEKFKAATATRSVTLRPGESGEVPVRSLNLDPKRFQYKVSNIGANGVTDLLAGKRWNPDLAGVISVWRDPADGKTYVVNGHHRVDRAKATGQSTMLVRMLDVKSATEARAVGALQNIAEGRGTVIDAAKFIRDSGISVDDLEAKGISMGEKTAQDGVALSRLDGRLFDMVVHGKMSQGRGIAIGRETPDAATQDAVLKLIEAAERRGQKVSDGTVGEIARFAQTAPQRQETVGSLFGDEQRTTSTALDKAQVSANILRELGAEKRAFGAVSSADRAARLEGAGNKINAADNAQRATEAEQAQEVYLRMSSRRGPIDDILNRAAEERSHAKPSEVAAIDRRAYEDVRAAISETLGGGEKPSAERSEGYATLSPQESISFLRRRTPSGNVESLTFPGMEDAVAEQEKSAADTKTEAEKEAVESSLSSPKADISAAAGEMERNSPLFFGSGAGGNQTLFDGIAEPDADTSKRASDLGSTFYSNPFDPVLFKKYIGKPMMELAAPLREELERRGDIAAVANSVHDTLQNLDRTNKATTLEAKGIARALEDAGFTKADGDQVFAHLEDPSGVKLTPKQEELRDQWIKPLDQRAALQRQIALLIKSGEFPLEDILSGKVPVEDVQRIAPQQENYQHRIAANKNSFVDKILGDSMKRFRSPGSALSRAFSSSKRSVFQEIRGLDGQREAVAVKGGRVTRFRMGEDGKPETQDLGDYRSRFVNAEDLLNEKTEGVSKRIAKINQAMNTLLNSAKGRDFTQDRIDSLKNKLESLKAEEERVRSEYSPESLKDRAVTRQELLDKAIAPIQRKVDALNKEWDILTATPARWKSANRRTDTIYEQLSDLDQMLTAMKESITPESAQEKLWYDPKSGKLEPREEGKDGQKRSDVLKQRLTPIKNRIDRLASQIKDLERITNRTPKLQRDLERMHKRLTELEQTKAGIEDAHQEEGLEGRYWRDKDGSLWRFHRGTTKFITERTGQKYHANAMLSSLVNYMETNKAMNAAIVMERTKGLLEDQGMALKTDNPATVPEGWKPTTLLQMHGYYFPAYIADAFDQFDYLQSRGQPNVLERANRFIIQSVLMNPLMHGKNIAANAFTGKAAEAITGRALVPSWYKTNAQAGIKAVNTLRDMGGSEYRRLLRLGLDLQGADSSFDQTTKDILRSFTEQLDKDKEQNVAMSALMGVGNAAKWLQGKNHLATFGLNDLFLLQSFYAREAELQAKGVPNASEAARDWAHQQVVEYTTPIRVGGSSSLARLMENSNLSAFWRYHFGGILRPVMNAVKEAAGTFTPEEEVGADGKERNSRGQTRTEARTNALARLAVMTLFATVIFPKVLDQIAKNMTGDQQAKAPRGGVLGFASNIAETIQGDRTPASLAGSVFTPALGTEEALEAIINRDLFTGRHIMGTNVDAETKVKQLAAWLTSKTTPGQMTNRLDQGKGKQVMWSLLGFTFPMEHGLLEAAKIRSEAAGSNPPDPKASKVWHSILAAAEQSQRSEGKDTRLADALLASGKLSENQEKELQDALYDPPIIFAVNGMNGQQLWSVYQKSTDQEKIQLLNDTRVWQALSKREDDLRDDGDTKTADAIEKELNSVQ